MGKREVDMRLNLKSNIGAPDDFYALLIDAHQGLTEEQSQVVHARLILLLANHIGDMDVLKEAIAEACEGIGEPEKTL